MGLTWLQLDDLSIEDERSLAHVGVYAELKRWLRASNTRFAVMSGERADHALVLNLAFWRPGDVAEVLADDVIAADQVAHNAWHAAAAARLGAASRSAAGLLLAEAVASAFDLYLVGRLLGHAPESSFLATQVPAMTEAAFDAGLDEDAFAALLAGASRDPEAAFEGLRQLLFDGSRQLLEAPDLEAAAAVFEGLEAHPYAALLHHYELSTWVLFARCYGEGDGAAALAVDRELRESADSLAWLVEHWLDAD